MDFYLRENFFSSNKGKSYAQKGEKVKLVSNHDNCSIVESLETGIRFGINNDLLSQEYVPKEIISENTKNKKK